MLTFKEYLTEGTKEDCIAKFEKVLFGDFRGKDEPDTEYESNIFYNIERFVKANSKSHDIVRAFEELAKCKKVYPYVLQPNADRIYRGTKISAQDFFASEWQKVNLSIAGPMLATRSFVYKPTHPVQSWSKSPIVAFNFSHHGSAAGGKAHFVVPISKAMTVARATASNITKKFIPTLYSASRISKNDLLFNTNFMNKLSLSEYRVNEYEIVRISKSPIKCTVMVHPVMYQAMLEMHGPLFVREKTSTIPDHDFDVS